MQLRMKVIQGKLRGQYLHFPLGEFMFGRGPECDVRPDSELVSRQHCLLLISETDALIRDLGSRNGTLINGQLVTAEQKLCQGDTLQLGPLVLEVCVDDESASSATTHLDTAPLSQIDTKMIPGNTPSNNDSRTQNAEGSSSKK